mmetsp:Transcript_19414/g.27441  ORF Transcript_19414/g.27441 Transcript_19414/m.27441 type:complete len:358 (+) Transcript_19414:181-1254(+)
MTAAKKIRRMCPTLFFVYAIFASAHLKSCHGLSLPISNTISYIEGQRCLFLPRGSSVRSANKDNEIKPTPPPLILLGGMAQTIASWEINGRALSRDRDVLIYECIGQGQPYPTVESENRNNNGDELYIDVSLPAQAEKLQQTITKAFPNADEVDIVGFSLGGRIAMAMCTMQCPHNYKIRRLHLTGVGAGRSPQGQIVVESWQDLLSRDNLRGFAWSTLMSTYSSEFLVMNKDKIQSWVQFIVDSNTSKGLHALAIQTQISDDQDAWHTLQLANRISTLDNQVRPEEIRLLVGEDDGMAPLAEVQKLHTEFLNCNQQILEDNGNYASFGVIENSGHALPMEQARLWRRDVLSFLETK